MSATAELVVVDSRHAPADRCLVCGSEVGAAEGIAARFGERTLRFKCPGCLNRFRADPGRYLSGHPGGCCRGDAVPGSPDSEWACF
jgi:hypothetical protein